LSCLVVAVCRKLIEKLTNGTTFQFFGLFELNQGLFKCI
jgi:hypothetical protein